MSHSTATAPARTHVRPRSQGRRESRAAYGFLAPSALGFVIFTIAPIIGAVAIAFFAWPVGGTPSFVGTDNFRHLATNDPVLVRALLNTIALVVLYVPLNIGIALGLALWISPRIRGRAVYRVLFYIPTVTPIVANALVWRLLLQPDGVVQQMMTSVGLEPYNFLGRSTGAFFAVLSLAVWQGFGANMLIFSAGLDSVPHHLYEAARIDGAGRFRQFVSVTLPMLSPAMFFVAVMTMIGTFQIFTEAYILTAGGPSNATLTMVMAMYQRGFELFSLGQASAIATVLFMLIALITAIQFLGQKRWVHYD